MISRVHFSSHANCSYGTEVKRSSVAPRVHNIIFFYEAYFPENLLFVARKAFDLESPIESLSEKDRNFDDSKNDVRKSFRIKSLFLP